MRFLVMLGLLASPVMAQDLTYSDAPLEACSRQRAEAPASLEACIGLAANLCQERTPGGYATVVISGCLAGETDWWDARLNAVYQQVRARVRQDDMHGSPNAPSQADALRDMQRAWIDFRDATCGFEAAQWGGGTGQGPAYVACLLQMTAEQVIYLETIGG